MQTTRLAFIVATIEGELAELAGALPVDERPAALLAELRVSWAALVKHLPLAESTLRGCPICMRVLPRTATFCGYCFSKLNPAPTSA